MSCVSVHFMSVFHPFFAPRESHADRRRLDRVHDVQALGRRRGGSESTRPLPWKSLMVKRPMRSGRDASKRLCKLARPESSAIASVSVLVVLGILIAVNYLSTRQNKRWDLTANQQFSLSEQTVKLLRELDARVARGAEAEVLVGREHADDAGVGARDRLRAADEQPGRDGRVDGIA